MSKLSFSEVTEEHVKEMCTIFKVKYEKLDRRLLKDIFKATLDMWEMFPEDIEECILEEIENKLDELNAEVA